MHCICIDIHHYVHLLNMVFNHSLLLLLTISEFYSISLYTCVYTACIPTGSYPTSFLSSFHHIHTIHFPSIYLSYLSPSYPHTYPQFHTYQHTYFCTFITSLTMEYSHHLRSHLSHPYYHQSNHSLQNSVPMLLP